MVEIKDIVDRESLEAWLKTRPRKTAVSIAYRTAMRVLPISLNWQLESELETETGRISLLVLRRLLISGVAANGAISSISNELKLAAVAAGPDPSLALTGSRNPNAVNTIAIVHYSGAAEKAAFVSSYCDRNPEIDWANWGLVRSECDALEGKNLLENKNLWGSLKNPLIGEWAQIKKQLREDTLDWSFWIKWYEAALNGEPLSYEMLERISLIPSEDWEQGPAYVNGLIAEIEEDFLLAATPMAEKVELSPETNRLRIVPERMSQRALYSNILEKIRDGMADLRDSPQFDNALSALKPVFEKVLDRTFDKYLSSPQRVHDDFVKAKRRIQKLLDVGEVAPNDEVVEFVDDLDAGAAHIRANMPQVRDSMAALAALRIAEASDADIEGIRAGAEAIAAQSEPEMAEEMRNDAADLVASHDVPKGAPKLLAPEVAYRLGHRIVESKQVLSKANVIKAGGVSAGVFTGSQMIIEAVRAILRLFGI